MTFRKIFAYTTLFALGALIVTLLYGLMLSA